MAATSPPMGDKSEFILTYNLKSWPNIVSQMAIKVSAQCFHCQDRALINDARGRRGNMLLIGASIVRHNTTSSLGSEILAGCFFLLWGVCRF